MHCFLHRYGRFFPSAMQNVWVLTCGADGSCHAMQQAAEHYGLLMRKVLAANVATNVALYKTLMENCLYIML